MGRLLSVVINDSTIHISGQAVIVRLQELVISGELDQVWSARAVHVKLASHVADHEAVAVRRPVAIHQLDVICPAVVCVRPGLLCGKAAGKQVAMRTC